MSGCRPLDSRSPRSDSAACRADSSAFAAQISRSRCYPTEDSGCSTSKSPGRLTISMLSLTHKPTVPSGRIGSRADCPSNSHRVLPGEKWCRPASGGYFQHRRQPSWFETLNGAEVRHSSGTTVQLAPEPHAEVPIPGTCRIDRCRPYLVIWARTVGVWPSEGGSSRSRLVVRLSWPQPPASDETDSVWACRLATWHRRVRRRRR